ncbi:hypothetical protein SGLAM104S_01988 [Streptomyces glaucescens]
MAALISAATYLAGKYSEGGRPVILSVIRAREAGDLDAPIRTGEDIEIRGAGFVPPGAQGADRLSPGWRYGSGRCTSMCRSCP